MQRRRATAAALGVSLLALAATNLPTAGAVDTGVGSSTGRAEALHLNIGGGALELRLLAEESTTTNDDPAGASDRVVPLTVSSSLLPQLSALTLPPVEVASTGPEDAKTAPGADLAALTSAAGLPAVLGGTIDATSLRAVVDATTGALAAATGGASNLSVLGGILQVGRIDGLLGSTAAPTAAGANRGLTIDSIELLDLGAVLQLLGLSPADLPLDVAADLLASLGLPLPGGLSADALVAQVQGLLANAGNVPATIDTLNAQIDALLAQAAGVQAQLTTLVSGGACQLVGGIPVLGGAVCDQITALQGQLSGINSQVAALRAQVTTLLNQVAGLLAPITGIVEGLLDGLEDAPLVVIEDLVVGVAAQATDTLEASTADVAASVGAVRIGTLPLPGVDALGTVDQLVALGDQLTGAVGGILATIDPSLAGLVDIGLFEKSTSIRTEGDQNIAEALLTGLHVDLTPPDLCGLLTRLGAADTIGGLLETVGGTLGTLPLPVTDVLGDLGSVVQCTPTAGATESKALVDGVAAALTQPLSLDVLTVSGRGAFAAVPTQVPGAPTPGTPGTNPVLPRTGSSDVVLLTLGVLAATAALGLRRVARAAR